MITPRSGPAAPASSAPPWTARETPRPAIAAARPGFDLKPFFCTAFPITLLHGTLWVDELCLEGPARCCRPAADGALSVLDVCDTELRHMLGDEGLEELRLAFKEYEP